MYLDKLYYKNVGPIEELNLTLTRSKQGNPKPVIFVGKNGSGKSIVLSNIVDAFYEIASKKFTNATQPERDGYQYYKELSTEQIRLGKNYLFVYLSFEQNGTFEYLCKSGEMPFKILNQQFPHLLPSRWQSKPEADKHLNIDEMKVYDMFRKDIACYFAPNRYMKPDWMGEKYMYGEGGSYLPIESKYRKLLPHPIMATNLIDVTSQWLVDVVADARADLQKELSNTSNYKLVYPDTQSIDLLSVSKTNLERVLSAILGVKVVFRLRNRSYGKHRLLILDSKTNKEVVPFLHALSTGQLALFNMFATIIRYADTEDLKLSRRLEEISGIVVIDEIELHLHSQLQTEVLPNLIKLFPKVQFVITTHSPLFLLGMKETFGEDDFDIFELPTGNRVAAEEFSEFENAYTHLTQTHKYQQQIQELISAQQTKPLIVTEGPTDWMHIKAAQQILGRQAEYAWIRDLGFELLEYKTSEQVGVEFGNISVTLEMGKDTLLKICEQCSKIPQSRKIIFIADCDDKEINKKFTEDNGFKNWGNSVFSMCLPVPAIRKQTPEICIEHFYTDATIKQSIVCEDGVERRLFLGNEFDNNGCSLNLDKKYVCQQKSCCGPGKINVIDGSGNKRVVAPWESPLRETNFALSKTVFAKKILQGKPPFDKVDFSNFIPLFEQIRSVLQLAVIRNAK